ncbi:site-specific integrase [Bacillus sp. 165]|uniref:site-specific integrase n=1 Tax=Bacillus sp. 165 TaxID=1529117 RepID=UPI001ADC93FB|nr:site-specific integrase [Bacillus sp. 165]MBO9128546.1 site-specific integrase [Bacillus sp. 165]
MDGVTAPCIKKKLKEIWTKEEAKRFLDVCEKRNCAIPFLLAIFTGMRRGEILGLKWRHIDLERGVIYVRENLVQTSSGIDIKELKTLSSLRDVHVSLFVVEKLREYKRKQETIRQTLGHEYADHDLVVCTYRGNPLFPRNLLRTFKSMIKVAGVPNITFHGLRHTHATILMIMGENPKVVQERLGHSRVAVTLDFYSHTNQEIQRKTATRFEEEFLHEK